jgi:hypothetical protein
MVEHHSRVPEEDPFAGPSQHRVNRVERRRARVVGELERNRRGEHRVPTWVLVAAVVLILAVWAVMILLV